MMFVVMIFFCLALGLEFEEIDSILIYMCVWIGLWVLKVCEILLLLDLDLLLIWDLGLFLFGLNLDQGEVISCLKAHHHHHHQKNSQQTETHHHCKTTTQTTTHNHQTHAPLRRRERNRGMRGRRVGWVGETERESESSKAKERNGRVRETEKWRNKKWVTKVNGVRD